MALKIQNEIGCDQGITDQAYIRINTYNIDKVNGNIDIHYSAYFNEEASKSMNIIDRPIMNRGLNQPIRNNKIGDSLNIPLKKEVVQSVTTMQMQPVQKEVIREIETIIDGVTTTGITTQSTSSLTTNYLPKLNGSALVNSLVSDDGTMVTVMKEVAVVNEYKTMVPDLSILDGVDIFAFCYGKLKEKLLIDFNDILDC